MKTAQQWSKDMRGETSPQIVKQIQEEAMLHAALVAKNYLAKCNREKEGRWAFVAIINESNNL